VKRIVIGSLVGLMVATTVALVSAGASVAQFGGTASARLRGFEEVPAISTTASGRFTATINEAGTRIDYELTYSNLTGGPVAAHIHLAQRGVNGGILAFLCGGGGKPSCPSPGHVEGQIRAGDVDGIQDQGIEPGHFNEVLRAIRGGVTYVNVHSNNFPGGEIRGQIQFTP
jgi:hypothetical protein